MNSYFPHFWTKHAVYVSEDIVIGENKQGKKWIKQAYKYKKY